MGIFYGLAAALGWGLGDYFIAVVTRRVGATRAMALTQTFSLATWLGLLLVWPSTPRATSAEWLIAVLSGACYVLAMWLSYRAFEMGALAVISPIISAFVVVTAMLEFATGERPTVLKLLGAAALFLGVILVTRPPTTETNTSRAGIPHAIGAALAFGVMFWMMARITPETKLGHVWPLIVLKVIASGLMWLMIAWESTSKKPAPTDAGESTPADDGEITVARATGAAAIFAVLDTGAWVAYIWGTRTEFTTVVTALASLFSAVAAAMGWLLLRERLAPNQWAGVAVVLLGVLLVSL